MKNCLASSYEGINKPKGGLWASPIDTDWGWKEWCEAEEYNTNKLETSFKFVLSDNAKVYHIRCEDDIYKLPIQNEEKLLWYFDWDKVAKEYDAIELHITDNYGELHYLFYAWDVDSIVILNKEVIKEVK